MSETDWRTVLTAQGVDAAVVDQAEETAAAMAAVAATLAHDPSEGVASPDIVRLLLAGKGEA